MRVRHVVGVAALMIIGLVLKQFFALPTTAVAEIPHLSMDVMQMHADYPGMRELKVDQMHDMQTVFTPQE